MPAVRHIKHNMIVRGDYDDQLRDELRKLYEDYGLTPPSDPKQMERPKRGRNRKPATGSE